MNRDRAAFYLMISTVGLFLLSASCCSAMTITKRSGCLNVNCQALSGSGAGGTIKNVCGIGVSCSAKILPSAWERASVALLVDGGASGLKKTYVPGGCGHFAHASGSTESIHLASVSNACIVSRVSSISRLPLSRTIVDPHTSIRNRCPENEDTASRNDLLASLSSLVRGSCASMSSFKESRRSCILAKLTSSLLSSEEAISRRIFSLSALSSNSCSESLASLADVAALWADVSAFPAFVNAVASTPSSWERIAVSVWDTRLSKTVSPMIPAITRINPIAANGLCQLKGSSSFALRPFFNRTQRTNEVHVSKISAKQPRATTAPLISTQSNHVSLLFTSESRNGSAVEDGVVRRERRNIGWLLKFLAFAGLILACEVVYIYLRERV